MTRGKLGLIREPVTALACPHRTWLAQNIYNPTSTPTLVLKRAIRQEGLATLIEAEW